MNFLGACRKAGFPDVSFTSRIFRSGKIGLNRGKKGFVFNGMTNILRAFYCKGILNILIPNISKYVKIKMIGHNQLLYRNEMGKNKKLIYSRNKVIFIYL